MNERAAPDRIRTAFLRACALDVAVRKPGNVSLASPGHGMDAAVFDASAQAAVGALLQTGARVGPRIEAAVEATWQVAHCNTNLGIVLLCAPLAVAVERQPEARTPAALRTAVEAVLADLDLADSRCAYRAIARANPGGLGTAPAEDVHAAPSLNLRDAMALAADRDLVARQYRDAYSDLFGLGLDALAMARSSRRQPGHSDASTAAIDAAAVQRLYLGLLGAFPDSHIVRKRGSAVAHTVMESAQGWLARLARRAPGDSPLDADPAFVGWDEALKASGVNPGTTADLTVATLMIAGLTGPW